MVDLPGYGCAEVPEAVRKQWQGLLEHYLTHYLTRQEQAKTLAALRRLASADFPQVPITMQLFFKATELLRK